MTTVVSYDSWRCRDDGSVVRHLQRSRCRATAVSCDGSEVSYDGGVVRRTTHSCDVVLEDYVTRIYYKCPKCISYFYYYILLIFKLKVEGCKPVSDIIIIRVVPPLTPHQ